MAGTWTLDVREADGDSFLACLSPVTGGAQIMASFDVALLPAAPLRFEVPLARAGSAGWTVGEMEMIKTVALGALVASRERGP